jgi:hypothetical protein
MRQRLGTLFGLLGFFLSTLTACTYCVGRGSDLYYQGRYIEAAHVLEMGEHDLRAEDTEDRALYGLYRGATLFRLGDLDGARRWLEYAGQISAAHPAMLQEEQRELLQETMIALRADLDRRAAARGL